MTLQEICDLPYIADIETEILMTHHHVERRGYHMDDLDTELIRELLRLRKRSLNRLFVMTDEYKSLLATFNALLSEQLLAMRRQAISLYHRLATADDHTLEVEGRCYLGYAYSAIHPIQTTRAKKIWALLGGTIGNYNPLYDDFGAQHYRCEGREREDDDVQFLFLESAPTNWNEGLDRERTADMQLIYATHNLCDHTMFSLFDILWVRDFNIELTANIGTEATTQDDLDWNAIDF